MKRISLLQLPSSPLNLDYCVKLLYCQTVQPATSYVAEKIFNKLALILKNFFLRIILKNKLSLLHQVLALKIY